MVLSPRFLSEKYERFFKDKNYVVQNDEEDSSFGLYSRPYYSSNQLLYGIMNKLIPNKEIGVYDVAFGFSKSDYTTEWNPAPPMRTLEVAKLLDTILQNIDDTENQYGMNCVEVLDNIDEMRKEQERLNIINQIKPFYTTNNEFKNMNTKELEELLANKDNVANIKNYGIIMDEVKWPYPVLIQDKNGYLDEIFNDYYNEKGWLLVRRDYGFQMRSLKDKDFYYSLDDKGEQKYAAHVTFYEGGSNLSSFCHLEDLVKLMQRLDEVADTISKR